MYVLLSILTPFAGALLLTLVAPANPGRLAWVTGILAFTALAFLLPLVPGVLSGTTSIEQLSWMPAIGLNLSLRLDGLGLLFALMIVGIGLLVILYARYYLSAKDSLRRLYAFLLLFMGSMLGVVLSENILLLLMFWELTGLSSFLLISYWRERPDARQGARMALAVTGAGGLALLAGFVLLGEIVGSYELSQILASGDRIRAHDLYLPTLVLILLGAFAKSAQFPLHFWLPHAMAAPTPVSAYLHSATMVKAGVFLLARLFPALSGTEAWSWLVAGIGIATLLVGAVISLFQHDIKGLLAYSTISHLGLVTALFGIGTPLAAVAGVFHIINHATFKAGLFMAAGIIDHECGTRDMRRINGLWRYMPYTAILAMVATAAMAGVPLLNGFLSKEMFFSEALGHATQLGQGWILPLAVGLASIFAVAYSLRFVHDVFFNGDPIDLPRVPHEPPRWMLVPVELLVLLCLLVGMAPALVIEPILKIAAAAVLQGPAPVFDLSIWHGISPALLLSLLAFSGGGLLYLGRKPLFAFADRHGHRLDAKRWFDQCIAGLVRLATWVTQAMDNGSLQRQVLFFVLTVLGLGALGMGPIDSPLTGSRAPLPLDAISLLAALVLAISTLAATWWHRQRLLALLLASVSGLVVTLAFVRFSAPDLALTQFSVEVVTMVLMLLALYFLPQQGARDSCGPRRLRDALIGLLAGSGAAALAFTLMTRPAQGFSDFFLAKSLPEGGGLNVVNVILVDFRGFDTLGEITVLALAGLAIHALLEGLRLPGPTVDSLSRAWSPDRYPLILATFARLLLPLSLLVSVYILLRGHNLPGGGFIAGLITTLAIISQYLAYGVSWTHQRISPNTQPLIVAGLGLALVTGFGSLVFGRPFLTSAFGHLHLPWIGDIELASAMGFDLGVYLVVVGASLLILIHLGLVHRSSPGPGDP